jgi:flagellar protein FlgJ
MPTIPPVTNPAVHTKEALHPLPQVRHPMPLQRHRTAGEEGLEELKGAAQSFEALYVYTLLKEMRKTVPEGGYLKSGIGHGVYQSMYDEALAEQIAETGSVGLAKSLVERYLREAQGAVQSERRLKFVNGSAEK